MDTTRKRKPGYEPIVFSASETWTTTRFIDSYLSAQGYAVSASNRELVRVVVRQYDGPRPIQAVDLVEFLYQRIRGPVWQFTQEPIAALGSTATTIIAADLK